MVRMTDLDATASRINWNDPSLDGAALAGLLAGAGRPAAIGKILSRGCGLFRQAGLSPREIVAEYPAARRFVGGRLRGMWDRVVAAWEEEIARGR